MRPPPRLQLFRGFLPPPLPLPLIRPPPPQPPRPLFLSSSLFPPFHRDSTFLSTACINKCALSFSSSRFPLDFFISSFFIERRQRERKRGFLASVLFTTDSPSPLFIVVSTVLFFFLRDAVCFRACPRRSIFEKALAWRMAISFGVLRVLTDIIIVRREGRGGTRRRRRR